MGNAEQVLLVYVYVIAKLSSKAMSERDAERPKYEKWGQCCVNRSVRRASRCQKLEATALLELARID